MKAFKQAPLHEELQEIFLDLSMSLSDECLWQDGEATQQEHDIRYAELIAEWKLQEGRAGRTVTEDEVWDRAKREARQRLNNPSLKEYYWTVEASGYVEATSFEEAEEIVNAEVDGLVSDDRKYWAIKVTDEEAE